MYSSWMAIAEGLLMAVHYENCYGRLAPYATTGEDTTPFVVHRLNDLLPGFSHDFGIDPGDSFQPLASSEMVVASVIKRPAELR